jgi:hypothetical protein
METLVVLLALKKDWRGKLWSQAAVPCRFLCRIPIVSH